jgi:hypothetical protein
MPEPNSGVPLPLDGGGLGWGEDGRGSPHLHPPN